MAQLEHIGAIERRLWKAADTLRANSKFASNEYFLPVMGLVFLRYAYSRFLAVKDDIEANLPKRGGQTPELAKADFSQKGAIFLRPKAQFDYLVELPEDKEAIRAVIAAMESIEDDYSSLEGMLPKNEYQDLDNDVLRQLLRILNPDELKQVSGDVFGRIYEYFLTQFADIKAHDDGEFFTPISIVSLIANVLEPENGVVLDPACGSGGMFVQSARFVERMEQNPTEKLTFYGMEKNATTIRLAKMNLAVHGLEGDIQQAITYYEDPHELAGKADFVMANPPFNVDEIDAEKIKNDKRLTFGLPGVNKEEKVSNGNYVWISYFHSYLGDAGRAGFVMSSQASSAGGGEAKVRQRLVETGDVDVMIAIRPNFFYTRAVPCELWFFDREKPATMKDKVLMLDARGVYRKVTRKIYDFSPEQMQNLLAIVWLYRGESERFLELVSEYLWQAAAEGEACFEYEYEDGDIARPFPEFIEALDGWMELMTPFLKTLPADGPHAEAMNEQRRVREQLEKELAGFKKAVEAAGDAWEEAPDTNEALNKLVEEFVPMRTASIELVAKIKLLYKTTSRLIDLCVKANKEQKSETWKNGEINKARKAAEEARIAAIDQLKRVDHFWDQAAWLAERFPDAELQDVEGLVKLVDRMEIEDKDWSLTPGRYVGVAPEEEDEEFDFEETIREIHLELQELASEAEDLTTQISSNLDEMLV